MMAVIVTAALGVADAQADTPRTGSSSSTTSATYRVRAGDRLYRIAADLRVPLTALLDLNHLRADSLIRPGDVLVVPAATVPPTTSVSARKAATSTTSTTLAKKVIVAPAIVVKTAARASAAAPTPTPATTTSATTVVRAAGSIGAVIEFAVAQLGKPYAFNTAGPDTYDCSGLVTAAFQVRGVELPHQSSLQATKGAAVDWRHEAIVAGDLVFTARAGVITHVGIAIDGGRWVHAPRAGDVVKIAPLPADSAIVAVRRIVAP